MREPTTVLLSTGQRMPLIGLGTYKLQSAEAVKTALELGYRHFDCESGCWCWLLILLAGVEVE